MLGWRVGLGVVLRSAPWSSRGRLSTGSRRTGVGDGALVLGFVLRSTLWPPFDRLKASGCWGWRVGRGVCVAVGAVVELWSPFDKLKANGCWGWRVGPGVCVTVGSVVEPWSPFDRLKANGRRQRSGPYGSGAVWVGLALSQRSVTDAAHTRIHSAWRRLGPASAARRGAAPIIQGTIANTEFVTLHRANTRSCEDGKDVPRGVDRLQPHGGIHR